MNTCEPTPVRVRALIRGLDVVRILNERRSTPLRLLVERTGLPRPTLLRILSTLDAAGWVYRQRIDNSYRLKTEACSIGRHLLTSDRIAECATPVMDRLYAELGWPSDIAVCSGQAMQIVDSTRRMRSGVGGHNPPARNAPMLWSALGRTYLAFCPDSERETILDVLRRSPDALDQAAHNRRWLEGLLEETRTRGYGMAEPGHCEWHQNCRGGLRAIAVPAGNHGQVRACLNLVWIEGEGSLVEMAGRWLPALRLAAQEIAGSLRRCEAGEFHPV